MATRPLAVMSAVAALLAATAAYAHDGEAEETAAGNRHAFHDFSHESGTDGHIETNVNYGLRPVGQDTLGGVSDGRYTDVWADNRGFAYVGTFQRPDCDRSGVWISDIRDPARPSTVGMINSLPNVRVNDVKTIEIENRHFRGTVLVHTLEPCGILVPGTFESLGEGGISLWDVNNPARPRALKQTFYDVGVHNTFPWSPDGGSTAYLIFVDDARPRDVVIADISKPQSPSVIARVGLPDWPQARDAQSVGMGEFFASLNHDVWVDEVGGRFLAVVSYWDAGWVVLDVTDPAAPVFVDDSTYPEPDPVTGFPPEGNAHAGVFDATGSRIFAGDEDFSPFRTFATVEGGPFAGQVFDASQGTQVPQIGEGDAVSGGTVYVGLACDTSAAVPPASETVATVAVVQRGTCTFTEKAANVSAAGYAAGIIFNEDSARSTACESLLTMLMEGDIPFVFVKRSTGFSILGIDGYDPADCGDGSTEGLVPAVGTGGQGVKLSFEFEGWGYFHLLDRATLQEAGWYAPGEVNDPDYARGFGDLTMHNVEGDPADADLAFISWYSLGMRAVKVTEGFQVRPPGDDWDAATPGVDDYHGDNVREVARFIAPEGSNFWGVHVSEVNGERYVLGSDRNTGLWIFSFDPDYCDPVCP